MSRLEDDRQDTRAVINQLGANVAQQNEHLGLVEADLTQQNERLGKWEATVAQQNERLGRVEIAVAEIRALLLATLPHLATKADVAEVRAEAVEMKAELLSQINDKPRKTYIRGVLAVLLTAYACGLAALAVLR